LCIDPDQRCVLLIPPGGSGPAGAQLPVGRASLAMRENAPGKRAAGMRYDWVLVLEAAMVIAIVALALVLWF
jgi:hypothetical protein